MGIIFAHTLTGSDIYETGAIDNWGKDPNKKRKYEQFKLVHDTILDWLKKHKLTSKHVKRLRIPIDYYETLGEKYGNMLYRDSKYTAHD